MAELCAENAFPCEDAGKITLDTIDIGSDKKLFGLDHVFDRVLLFDDGVGLSSIMRRLNSA